MGSVEKLKKKDKKPIHTNIKLTDKALLKMHGTKTMSHAMSQ